MTIHAANPAGRLWLYYDHVTSATPSKPVQDVAADYLGVDAGANDRFLIAMAELLRLPDEVEARVAVLQNQILPAEKLLNPLAPIRRALTSDPLGQQLVKWHRSLIDATVLSELQTTSYVLAHDPSAEAAIDEDTLESIKDLADTIIDLATAAEDIDDATKAAFIRHGHRIKEAADLSKVAGVQPLADELDRFHQRIRRGQTPSGALWEKTKELTGVIIIALELFTAPVNFAEAIDFYTGGLEQRQLVEAPAPSDDIIDGEIVEERDALGA